MKGHSFQHWRSQVINKADRLAMTDGLGVLPIDLGKITQARKIHQVVFRPLLVDACLSLKGSGFKVYIACPKERSSDFQRRLTDEATSKPLPSRVRFTIAHEIAHTLFYDITKNPPKNHFGQAGDEALDFVERHCNAAARRLLLPDAILADEIRTRDFFDPEELRSLADRAGISGQPLIYRLKETPEWAHGEIGGAAYVLEDSLSPGRFFIRAITLHRQLRDPWKQAREHAEATAIASEQEFVLNGGTRYEIEVERRFDTQLTKGLVRCLIRCEHLSRSRQRGFFVTLQRLGQPQIPLDFENPAK